MMTSTPPVSELRIRELRVRTLLVPLSTPHRTASGIVSASPLVLTEVVTDGGVIGQSVVFTYTPAALNPTAELVRNCEAILKGDLLAPFEIEQKLARRFRLLGTQGLVGMAIAAIDMAVWDALARCHEVSLLGLLGGIEKPISVYGAVGYDGSVESARVAAEWAAKGFRGVKAKIGYPSVGEDVEVIRAIRKAVGDDVAIMVDYNQSLTPGEAIERMQVLDGEGLAWVEEPTLAHDFAGHALIARAARTPIQCGENWWGVLDMQHAIDAGAADLVMPDVMKIGGVTGWLRAAALAQTRGIRMSSHLWPELSAQLLCVTPTAHWLEYSDWWNPILRNPLRVVDGVISIGDVAGAGMAWDEESVQRFSAE
jgi:mandelate racemase